MALESTEVINAHQDPAIQYAPPIHGAAGVAKPAPSATAEPLKNTVELPVSK